MLRKRKTRKDELNGIHLKHSIEDLLDKNKIKNVGTETVTTTTSINKCSGCESCKLTKNMDQLFDHQKEGICWMMKQEKGGLIADEMGMGKTRQIIAYLLIRNLIDPPILSNKILIIVPCILKNQWQKEIEFWYPSGIPKNIQLFHYEQFYSQTKNKFNFFDSFDIEKKIQENLLQKDNILDIQEKNVLDQEEENILDKQEENNLIRSSLTCEKTQDEYFDELILDECHNLRNQGKIFESILSLKKKRTWCLSGTPFINSINDIQFIISLLELKNKMTLNNFYQKFVLKRENFIDIEKEEIEISISHTCNEVEFNSKEKEKNIILENIDFSNDFQHSLLFCKSNSLFELTKQRLKLNLCSLPYNQSQQLDEFYKRIQFLSIDNRDEIFTNQELDQLKKWKLDHCKWKKLKDILERHPLDHCIIFSYSASILKWLEIFSRLDFPSRSTYHLSGETSNYNSTISSFSNIHSMPLLSSEKKKKKKLINLDGISNSLNLDLLSNSLNLDLLSNSLNLDLLSNSYNLDGASNSNNLDTISNSNNLGGISNINEKDQKSIHSSETLLQNHSTNNNSLNYGSILFMTLQLGNAGLNLTCANVIIFLEPWWNKAIEEQAQARIIRTGQTKKCFIYRFSSSHPLDDQIKDLQNFKIFSIQRQLH